MIDETRVNCRVVPDKILKDGKMRFSVHFPARLCTIGTSGWRYDPVEQAVLPPAVYHGFKTVKVVWCEGPRKKDAMTAITRKAKLAYDRRLYDAASGNDRDNPDDIPRD